MTAVAEGIETELPSGRADRELAWRAWPVRQHPVRGGLALVLAAGTIWGTWDWTRDPWLAGLAGVILAVATAPFFVPTRYRMSGDGVEISRPWRSWNRSWDRFRAVRGGGELVVLSTFARPSWLDSFRGEKLYLESGAEEVIAFAEEMVGKKTEPGAR